jgi:hypothetical protein
VRIDSKTPKIKDEVIRLLKTTTLTQTEIGKLVGCSRGPVNKIFIALKLNRPITKSRIRDKIPCKTCGTLIKHIIFKVRNRETKFCSKQCYTAWQKSLENKGSNNPGWQGGKESKLSVLRKTSEWKVWRTKIFERDNYTCQKCKTIGGILHPHHIIPKSVDITLVYNVDNGITLCKKCHMEVHYTKDINYMKIQPKISNQYLIKTQEAFYMHS